MDFTLPQQGDVRAPNSSPADDTSELLPVAMGGENSIDDDVASLKNEFDSTLNVDVEEFTVSKSEIAFKRWLDFINSDKLVETLEKAGSDEFRLIRSQILEEFEWKRQGLIGNEHSEQDREAEAKRIRLQLAAKRGWDTIRSYIRKQSQDKHRKAAKKSWKNMLKVAKKVASIEDKTLLDLYERYGFLGWEDQQELPPFNPMFPDKSVKLAKARAVRLQQIALQHEIAESLERVTKLKRSPRDNVTPPPHHAGDISRLKDHLRAVTLLHIPSQPSSHLKSPKQSERRKVRIITGNANRYYNNRFNSAQL